MPAKSALKRLCLLRHAKAKRGVTPDFERPLTKRGRHAAALMGEWMQRTGLAPNRVLYSPAKRTEQTWMLLNRRLMLRGEPQRPQSLYGASAAALLEHIRALPDSAATVMVIGHNPGLENLARELAGPGSNQAGLEAMAAKFPTAALAVFEIDAGAWHELRPGGARLVRFIRPADLA